MAYAAVSDMVTRFGQAEMIRLSTPQNQPMDAVITAPVLLALGDASDIIDTYVSKRYQTPMTMVPPSISRACCILARYDLCTGDGRSPSEEVTKARDAVISWLKEIASGKALLPLDEVPAGDNSFAQMSDRGAVYGPGSSGTSFPAPSPTYPQSDQGGPNSFDATPLPPFFSEQLG